jgi:Ca2+-binding EF-hand superfamily protein
LLRARGQELGNIFDAYDADGSAAMSASELKVLLDDIAENGAGGVSGHGSQSDGNPQADDDDGEHERRAASAVVLSEEDLEMFIAAMDANGDGRLGRDEFLDYCMRGMNMRSKQRKKFAKRSPMHAKLQLFIANILKRIEEQ